MKKGNWEVVFVQRESEKLKATVFPPSPVDGSGRWYCERVDLSFPSCFSLVYGLLINLEDFRSGRKLHSFVLKRRAQIGIHGPRSLQICGRRWSRSAYETHSTTTVIHKLSIRFVLSMAGFDSYLVVQSPAYGSGCVS
ncbi:hypothetical protein DY000_02034588 [Brassica cretica]|uniref:Uncharacterized protein n=1 Tax=Brassica cretica TaxID=69181 RepID=A0ABQ7DKY2_BRACR|nr:hypothetical protein DY000_02034588 [Brassica cretica]